MHFQRSAERTEFTDQYAAALAQGAIDGFDDVGLAFALWAGPVLPTRQHLGVGFPLVGKIPAMAPVTAGQGEPAFAQRGFAPTAQRPAHDASTGAFDYEPQPDLAPLVAHEAPQLIQFQDFPFLALRLLRT